MADKKKKKKEKTWDVEITCMVINTDCPAREKQRGGYVCDETGKRCNEKNCYGCTQ